MAEKLCAICLWLQIESSAVLAVAFAYHAQPLVVLRHWLSVSAMT
jgi:hypothetical protein